MFVSNVLEHFRNPYEVLWNNIAIHARKFIVVLVPYEEFLPNRCKEHEYTFCRDNISLGNATWQIVGFKIIDKVPDNVFPAMECMIIYAKNSFRKNHALNISDIDGASEFSCKLDAFVAEKNMLSEKVKTAESQRQVRFEKDQQILAANKTLTLKMGDLEERLRVERENTDRLRMTVEHHKSDLEAKDADLVKISAEYAQLKKASSAEIAKQKEEFAKLADEKSSIAAALAKQNTLLIEEQSKTKELNEKLAVTRNELDQIKNEALESRVGLDAERKVSDSQAEQINVLKAALQFATSRPQIEANDTRLLEYSQEVRELRTALDSKRDEVIAMAEKTGRLSGQIEVLAVEKRMLQSEIDGLAAKLSDERKTAKSREEIIAAKDREAGEAKEYAALCESENAKLASENKVLTERIGALQDECEKQAEALKSTESDCASSNAALQRIAAERTGLDREVALLKTRLSEMESEKAALLDQLAKAGTERNVLDEKVADGKGRQARLEAELDRQRKENAQLGRIIAQIKADLAESASAAAAAQAGSKAEADSLRKKLDDEIAHARAVLIDEQKKTANVTAQLKKANETFAEERRKQDEAVADAKRRLAEMQKRAMAAETAVKDAATAKVALESTRKKLEADLTKSRTAESAATKQISELSKALSTLRSEYAELKEAKSKAVRLYNEKAAKFKNLSIRYKTLAGSKLGRLTLAYWHLKGKKSVTASSAVTSPKAEPTTALSENVTPQSDSLPLGDEEFFSRIEAKIAGMPESNGSRYYKKIALKIGIICDQFYWDSVYSAADFVYIRPEAWKEDVAGIDCLLMVSAWHGLRNGTDWQGLPYEGTKRRLLAYEIMDVCKTKGVPVIFYSKEDPPSYKEFLGIAKRCDCVFTSAEECVSAYKRDCGHDRVWPLRFCINPTYHNPVGMRYEKQKSGVIFSGSWMTKFPDRCKDLAMMFDGIISTGREMRIIDRCYHLRKDERYRYPDKYLKCLSPAIGHKELQKVHKLYDWAVNINTVRDSRTMFANRVFELQASGNLLLSNYSLGVSNLFPTVFMPYDSKEAARILDSFTPEEIYERQISGIRRVMTDETCCVRLAEMLSLAGIHVNAQSRHMIVVADKITDKIQMMFDNQTYRDKELVCASELTDSVYEGADLIAFMADGYNYGPFYLEDMANGFKYTDSDYVTKDAFIKKGRLESGIEHDYVREMKDKYRTVFWRSSFQRKQLLKMRGKIALPNGYSIDHFNLEIKKKKPEPFTPKVSVVIPVYNNGWYLYGRAFAALRRSSLFGKMEIIIVDDGSTDAFTPKMVKHLEATYPNVRAFFFGDGGSGTPSRPRNKGVKLAKSDFIIFHDPDNEAICDGYATLFSEMESEELDVSLGNTVRCDGRNMTFDYYSVVKHNNGNNVLVTDGRKVLVNTTFLPANIQTMVIRKSFLMENALEQVVGGIGEDSLLCNQMMLLAKKLKVYPVKVQIYYAERGDSIVNAVSENFFIKHDRTEVVRVKWLRETGLLDDYMRKRFTGYVTGWYFQKLASVMPENRGACCRKLLETLNLYDNPNPNGDSRIREFIDLTHKGEYEQLFETVILPLKRGEKGIILMPEVKSFSLPTDKTFVRYSCATKGEAAVSISGEITANASEKPVLMRIIFEDDNKKVLNTGKLPYSPKFGEHIFPKNGAFHNSVKVPPHAKTLTLCLMRGDTTGEVCVSKLKVTSL